MRPSVARFDPSTTTCLTVIRVSKSTSCAHCTGGCCNRSRRFAQPLHARVVDARVANVARSVADDDERGHRSPAAPHPQRVRERRHRGSRAARCAARICSQTYLEGDGLDIERYEPAPGRTSLVTRIEGTDPDAPTLLLMGHTDVVPVNPDGWRHDPFGGELIDGEVWGRGAVDMLNLTASMAVATKRLARDGLPPRRARSSTWRSPTRRRSAPRRRPPRRARGRRGAGRLRDHRVRRHPDPQPHRPEAAGDRGREGQPLGPAAGVGHARPRQPAVQDRQRAGHGGRGRPAASPSTSRPPRSTTSGASSSRAWSTPTSWSARCSIPTRFVDALRRAAGRHGPPVPRLHPHDVRADDRPRRHQDQRDPRPRRPADRHPHAARATARPRCGRCSTRRSATWRRRSS